MEADKTLNQTTKAKRFFAKNNTSTSVQNHYAKCSLEANMTYTEAGHKKVQEYYNKASGCSVKAQKDNLFDYNSLLDIKPIVIPAAF